MQNPGSPAGELCGTGQVTQPLCASVFSAVNEIMRAPIIALWRGRSVNVQSS